jgi:hypothetical protein
MPLGQLRAFTEKQQLSPHFGYLILIAREFISFPHISTLILTIPISYQTTTLVKEDKAKLKGMMRSVGRS